MAPYASPILQCLWHACNKIHPFYMCLWHDKWDSYNKTGVDFIYRISWVIGLPTWTRKTNNVDIWCILVYADTHLGYINLGYTNGFMYSSVIPSYILMQYLDHLNDLYEAFLIRESRMYWYLKSRLPYYNFIHSGIVSCMQITYLIRWTFYI